MAIEIENQEKDGDCLIKVTGEVDLYTSPELRGAILKADPQGGTSLGVDLSKVTYMDSSGVATLVEGLKTAGQKRVEFVLVSPSPPVMKVLQLARLDTVFEIRDTM